MTIEIDTALLGAVQSARETRIEISSLISGLLNDGQALVGGGSVARGDFSVISDLDLMLVGVDVTPNLAYRVESNIRKVLRRETSVRLESVRTSPSLRDLLFCHESCLIAGSKSAYHLWCQSMKERLFCLTPTELVSLHTNDPRRHAIFMANSSHFSHSIKRGKGGFIDYSYLSLVITYNASRLLPLPNWIEKVRGLFRELVFLKLEIVASLGFARDVVDIADELSNVAVHSADWYIEKMALVAEIVETTKVNLNGLAEDTKRLASPCTDNSWRPGICIFELL